MHSVYHVRRGYSVEAYMVYTVYIMLGDLRSSECLSLVLCPWNLLLLYPFTGKPFIPLSKDAFTSHLSSDLKNLSDCVAVTSEWPKVGFFCTWQIYHSHSQRGNLSINEQIPTRRL